MIEPWIEEYWRDGLTLNTLNKLYTYWKKVNYSFDLIQSKNEQYIKEYHEIKPRVIIQLGRKERFQIQNWQIHGFGIEWNKYDISKQEYEIFLNYKLNAEIEQVDKESYLWIREKL